MWLKCSKPVIETSNGWAKCAYQGKTGYVSSVYISTAEVDNSTPISGAEGGVHITSSGGRVNIRRGNGTEYSVITSVVPGTILPYVAKAVNGWLAVKTGKQVGWVHPDFALTDELNSVD